jgi:hypothetical protein
MAGYQHPRPLLKRLIKVARQTAEHPRRSENNYFHLLLRTMTLSPWADYQAEHQRSVPNQNIATASKFAHRLAQAKNFQEFAQIETAFIWRLLGSEDFAQEATKSAADSVANSFSGC